LKAELESEGLVLIEEGVKGSLRYHHFKAPGKRFHGKITPERFGIGISEERFVVYCRSGRVKLIDSAFSNPRLAMFDISLDGDDTVVFRIDYDRADEKNVSGQIRIVARTPNAPTIVGELGKRCG
jgi:hypothetical protein